MNKKFFISLSALLIFSTSFSQDAWVIKTPVIDPANYYGETVANGVIGIVSSAEPLKCKDVVLNGAYDQYGRGRVSNFFKELQPGKYEPRY